MASETILHSGKFATYDGDEITVTFFRRIDLNASPTSLSFSDAGGSRYLTIWSTMGDAHLADPTVEWLNYQLVSTEPVVGTPYYKYTYRIICDSNSGMDRETVLIVDLRDDIPGEMIYVPVTQISGIEMIGITPSTWSAPNAGGYSTFSVSHRPTNMSQVITYDSGYEQWVTVTFPTSSTMSIRAGANSTQNERFATVKLYDMNETNNYSTIIVSQGVATLTVYPSYSRWNVGGGHGGFVASWYAGSEPTAGLSYATSDTSWISIYGASVSGSVKTWNMAVSENTTLVERQALVTITNGIDTVYLPIYQNRQ